MHRAIKALLDVVPAHNTLEMGAESAKLLDVAILILVDSKWLLGALLLIFYLVSIILEKEKKKREDIPCSKHHHIPSANPQYRQYPSVTAACTAY